MLHHGFNTSQANGEWRKAVHGVNTCIVQVIEEGAPFLTDHRYIIITQISSYNHRSLFLWLVVCNILARRGVYTIYQYNYETFTKTRLFLAFYLYPFSFFIDPWLILFWNISNSLVVQFFFNLMVLKFNVCLYVFETYENVNLLYCGLWYVHLYPTLL